MTRVMGIDLSSRKIAIVRLSGDDYESHTVEIEKLPNRPDELSALQEGVEGLMDRFSSSWVYIEAPVVGRGGARPTVLQAQVDGIVQSAAVRFGHLGAYSVNNKTWKKDVVGNGNAGKDDTKSWLAAYHPVLTDLCGDDQDLVDAAGVALYGRAVIERAQEFERTIRLDPR